MKKLITIALCALGLSFCANTTVKVCEEGVCTSSDNSDTTVCYGSYVFKYNGNKSLACEKKGITRNTLGLPFYVDL